MAFHLENNGLAVANIHDASVFTGAANDLRTLGGQGAQPFLGGFVGAMLIPHRRENTQLGEGRRAADDVQNAVVFVGRKAVGCDQVWGDGWLLHVGSRVCVRAF